MFTGIITHLGTVEEVKNNSTKDLLLTISTQQILQRKLEIGCSIACNGVCLTLVAKKKSGTKQLLSFQASKETLGKTTLTYWRIGDLINLEFALRMGDELGGHLVAGHIDGIAKISTIRKIKDSRKVTFTTPKSLMKFIAPKGSITIDGTSLTVNTVNENSFSVNLISHTIAHTSFQNSEIGQHVNIEVDLLARYLNRMTSFEKGSITPVV